MHMVFYDLNRLDAAVTVAFATKNFLLSLLQEHQHPIPT